jgi:hypothetical protein
VNEEGRPVFAGPYDIDIVTGRVRDGAARLTPKLGRVLETQSGLRQTLVQASMGLTKTIGKLSVYHPYALLTGMLSVTTGQQRTRGFGSTTAGDPRSVEESVIPQPRYVGTGQASIFIPRWASIGVFVRVASATAFTPLVGSDINGDGYANDRAFVFDPQGSATDIASEGMERLLRTGSSAARECLARQLNHVADINSCSARGASL